MCSHMTRVVRSLLLACALLAHPGVPQPTRQGHGRIVAVGDLHGDITTARAILRSAGLMSREGESWVGGTDTLVQTGDLVDRGPDGHAIIDLMLRLRSEARLAGGKVHLLVGNHELMNLKGELSFVDPRDTAAHGGPQARAAAFSPTGRYGQYIRALPLSLAIGSTVFCHAGILAQFGKLGIHGINAAARESITAGRMYDAVLMNDGPVWTRTVITEALAGRCDPLEQGLAALSRAEGRPISRMVIGHTAQPQGTMGLLCGSRLAAIDVYASAFYAAGGFNTFLEINDTGRGAVSWAQVGPVKMPSTSIRNSAKAALEKPSKEAFDVAAFDAEEKRMRAAEAAIDAAGKQQRGGGKTQRPVEEQLEVYHKREEVLPSHARAARTARPAARLHGVAGVSPHGHTPTGSSKMLVLGCGAALAIAAGAWWRLVVLPQRRLTHSKKK